METGVSVCTMGSHSMKLENRWSRGVTYVVIWMCLAMSTAASARTDRDLVIYLHNAWYEKHKDGTPHPKFGVYHLRDIHKALGKGVDFRAPEREADADPTEAAKDLVALIRTELAAGRKPSAVKVIGASKGGVIGMLASTMLAEPDVRWVIIGGCSPGPLKSFAPKLTGQILSIYEASDTVAGPCPDKKALLAATTRFMQIRVETGLDHGFLFSADTAWVTPATDW